ncbi:hypothetical protein DRO69_00475 [Candidatus Bathyarchaeota archaeon]|nr:MAG: hypothetical protein DRO69_00475 [Candidatus Bathyarchaeota archaeon]
MKKNVVLILLLIFAMFTLTSIQITFGQTVTPEVGYYAVKYVPQQVSGLRESTFEGFVKNATHSDPIATVNITSVVRPSEATWLGTHVSGELSDLTYVDGSTMRFESDLRNGFQVVALYFNVSLNWYHVFNESWVSFLNVTVYGNSSILCDVAADVYIYNYTASEWIYVDQLNSTTLTHCNYIVPNGSEPTVLDEKIHQTGNVLFFNTLLIKIVYNDTATSFTVDIDCIEVTVNYQFNIEFQNWSISQEYVRHPSTGLYVYSYFSNTTIVLPDEWEHPSNNEGPPGNYTIYFVSDSEKLMSDVSFDITLPNQYCSYSLPSKLTVELLIDGDPSVEIPFNLHFYLTPVYIIDADGCKVLDASFTYDTFRLAVYLDGTGSKELKFYIANEPYRIYVDGDPYTNYVYNKQTYELTVFYSFGSIHLIEVEQYSPSQTGGGGGGGGFTPSTPSLPSVPTPRGQQARVTFGIVAIIVLIGGAYLYSEISKKKSLSKLWQSEVKKGKKVKWKKRKWWFE